VKRVDRLLFEAQCIAIAKQEAAAGRRLNAVKELRRAFDVPLQVAIRIVDGVDPWPDHR
jgi:hypothetical protein